MVACPPPLTDGILSRLPPFYLILALGLLSLVIWPASAEKQETNVPTPPSTKKKKSQNKFLNYAS